MAAYDWSPFLVGGATRPDAITGLNPAFRDSVWSLLQAAAQDGLDLRITSAYRSPEVQAQLWENALTKYGSPEAARKWVAPPGRSQHNFGTAVDFAGPGGLLRDANSPEAQWLKANAERFGLAVPMSWEPWQVELAGARERSNLAFPGILPTAAADAAQAASFSVPAEKPKGLLARMAEAATDLPYQQSDEQLLPRIMAPAYAPQARANPLPDFFKRLRA